MKGKKVRFSLDTGNIKQLPEDEIIAILRTADEMILTGGRNLLAKTLKGSRDQAVLKYGLDHCPTFGYFAAVTLPEITNRIDWMITHHYLKIEYENRLPLIAFDEKGWLIERETYSEELFNRFADHLDKVDLSFVQSLKGRDRGLILLLIEKIREKGDARFIPHLQAWKSIEFKKVQVEIQKVIDQLFLVPLRKEDMNQ